MKKSKLIDLFGLSKDSLNNDQLDDLLFRLELEEILTSRTTPSDILSNPDRQVMDSFIII